MRSYSTLTGQWTETDPPTDITTNAPSGVSFGGCAGCGGEKFTAKTPAEMEQVLSEHVRE